MKRWMIGLIFLMTFLIPAGCQRSRIPPDLQVPAFLKPYFKPGRCSACSLLDKIDWGEPGDKKYTGAVVHPTEGGTFFVNIDYDRVIIKIKPVRNTRSVVLLYDPYHQGTAGTETGSHYVQPRCTCGGNRFILGAGVSYKPGADAEDYTQFVLVGKCTLCGKRKVLFSTGS